MMRYTNCDLTLTLITLFWTLSLIDVITTSSIQRLGGRELNLFLAPFTSDPALFLAIKAIGVIIIIGLAFFNRLLMDRGEHVVLAIACGMSVYPALWNLFILWNGI